ncbi:unnamed protein product, partial [Ectocarpus sp. 12 AP-2014]
MESEKTMTHQESLELITKMIQITKVNIKGGSFYFLLWGWVVVLANLGQYLIGELTSYPHPYIIW